MNIQYFFQQQKGEVCIFLNEVKTEIKLNAGFHESDESAKFF